eukprot:930129-Rhodomonas_salina.1
MLRASRLTAVRTGGGMGGARVGWEGRSRATGAGVVWDVRGEGWRGRVERDARRRDSSSRAGARRGVEGDGDWTGGVCVGGADAESEAAHGHDRGLSLRLLSPRRRLDRRHSHLQN